MTKSVEQRQKELQLEMAMELLEEFYDMHGGTPCRFDHHGYCQEHFLEEGENCLVNRVTKFLEAYNNEVD